MHFQEAMNKSDKGIAIRIALINKRFSFFIWNSNAAYPYMFNGLITRPATEKESYGYDDWFPVELFNLVKGLRL